jgi:L,D-transpeptidase-like protein
MRGSGWSTGAFAGCLSVALRRTRPRVTGPQLIRRYPHYIVVDRDGFTLRLYRRLRLAESYPIAVGQQGLETPAGLYDVQNKQINPTWTVPNSDWTGAIAGRSIPPGPDNPLKARWLGFDGSAGIHARRTSDHSAQRHPMAASAWPSPASSTCTGTSTYGHPSTSAEFDRDQAGAGSGSGRTITVSATRMTSSTGRSASVACLRSASSLVAS